MNLECAARSAVVGTGKRVNSLGGLLVAVFLMSSQNADSDLSNSFCQGHYRAIRVSRVLEFRVATHRRRV